METYNQKDMEEAGLTMQFCSGQSVMLNKGVLRGLHFQKEFPQGKLVRVVKGSVFDVAVDLRSDSENIRKMVRCGADSRKYETVLYSGRIRTWIPGIE